MSTASWQSYALFLPLWIAVARWTAFVFLRVIPSIFYKQIKKVDLSKYDEYVNDDGVKMYKPKNNNGTHIEHITKEDVTAVVTVYEPPVGFMAAMKALQKNDPGKVLIIADVTCAKDVHNMLEKEGFDMVKFEVVSEEKPGKRAALFTGIKLTKTKLVALVDDDAIWCDTFLENLILPFQYPKIGGVGVKQVATMKSKWNITDVLADMRLSVRYLELRSTTTVDKGCSCISGRTGCYRTKIFQNEEFYHEFMNEKFFGMQTLSGDDKFCTRWVSNNGYDTYHQLDNSCKLETTFDDAKKLCFQLARWSRNTIRSDFKNLFVERKIWKRHPFTAFVMLDKFLTPFMLLFGPIFIITVFILKGIYPDRNFSFYEPPGNFKRVDVPRWDWIGLIGFLVWLLFSRAIRLVYHFIEKPHHIIYLPLFVLFQYYQAAVRIYAMFTVYNRSWGTRAVTVGKDGQILRTGDKKVEDNKGSALTESINSSPTHSYRSTVEIVDVNLNNPVFNTTNSTPNGSSSPIGSPRFRRNREIHSNSPNTSYHTSNTNVSNYILETQKSQVSQSRLYIVKKGDEMV